MAQKRDIVAEIESVRARHKSGWMPSSLVLWRLQHLRDTFEELEDPDPELLRYFPIAIVASLEGFFRAALAALIDEGPPFDANFLASPLARDMRLDIATLHALHGRRITPGELAAHLLPMSGLAHFNAALSAAAGTDFLGCLRQVRCDPPLATTEPEDGSAAVPELVLAEPEAVLADVAEAFRLRHIFAHEIADVEVLEEGLVARLLFSASLFTEAADAAVRQLLYPDAPRTQAEMTRQVVESAARADAALETQYAASLAALWPDRRPLFEATQRAWESYRDHAARFAGSEAAGGSLEPMLAAAERARVTLARTEEIAAVLRAAQQA